MVCAVRDSVTQIDDDSWLIGDQFVIYRQQSPPSNYLWKDGNGFWYAVSDVPSPLPSTVPLPLDSHIRQVHDAGDASAVWSFGDAFLKVKLLEDDFGNVTTEPVTLDWLAQREQQLSFRFPKVLHQHVAGGRSYLVVTRVPGEVLAGAWRSLADDDKEHYARRIVEIAEELAAWQSDRITGVDGAEFGDTWLDLCRSTCTFKPDELRKTCVELGMDCARLYLWHSDLGPHNIVVDEGAVGLIDWEMVGYVPRAWIRTKFSVCGAMDCAWPDVKGEDPAKREWRDLVERKLGEQGYPEVRAAYLEWYLARLDAADD